MDECTDLARGARRTNPPAFVPDLLVVSLAMIPASIRRLIAFWVVERLPAASSARLRMEMVTRTPSPIFSPYCRAFFMRDARTDLGDFHRFPVHYRPQRWAPSI